MGCEVSDNMVNIPAWQLRTYAQAADSIAELLAGHPDSYPPLTHEGRPMLAGPDFVRGFAAAMRVLVGDVDIHAIPELAAVNDTYHELY